MSDLRPIAGPLMAEVGDLLVRAEVGAQTPDQLHDEYSDVLDDFKRDRRSGKALLRMSWVALKAINLLEGSNASDRAGRGDGRDSRDDDSRARAGEAPPDRSARPPAA